ncbi:MAG: PAS domain S-box protein [Candidatus Hydrogenedentes bacterium]|nr:PAS domain S-box protein [Candidatus Hydrogenedentota bacterium]
MTGPLESRVALILEVERFALYARYIVFAILAPIYFLGPSRGQLGGIIIVGVVIGLHNLFVHWAFRSKRYVLFTRWWNLAAHLLEVSIVVAATGADSSDGYILYFFLLIGFSAYVRRFGHTLVATALCCASYGTILAACWFTHSITEEAGPMVARLCGIVITGWLVGALGQMIYKTERDARAKARALAVSETTLRTILDNTADPIVVFDENGIITDANNRAVKFLGEAREKLIGSRIRSFVFDDGTFPEKMDRLRARGQYHGEQVLVNSAGEERTADFYAQSYIRDGRQFFVVVVHDITKQKEFQEATRLANVDLERLNRELRQVDHLKTSFLTSMSQELRSPISAIMGYVEMMLNEELGELLPEQRKAVQTCRRSAARILRLVDDALELRGTDAGRAQPGLPPATEAGRRGKTS